MADIPFPNVPRGPVDHFAKAEEFLLKDHHAAPCSPVSATFRERAAIHAQLAHTEALRGGWNVVVNNTTITEREPQQHAAPFVIDAAHLARQRAFSLATFGPGKRTAGVIDHVRKELAEIMRSPADLSEWADAIILLFDGALRRDGIEPQQILDAIADKQARNEVRSWPDWRTQDPNKAIEHVKTVEPKGEVL